MKGGYLIIDCGGVKLDTITKFPAGTFAKITACKGKPILLNNFILTSNGQPTGAFGAVTITSSKYDIEVIAGGELYKLLIESDDDVTASKVAVYTGTLPDATKTKKGVVKMADCHQSWGELDTASSDPALSDIILILTDLYSELVSAGIISKT